MCVCIHFNTYCIIPNNGPGISFFPVTFGPAIYQAGLLLEPKNIQKSNPPGFCIKSLKLTNREGNQTVTEFESMTRGHLNTLMSKNIKFVLWQYSERRWWNWHHLHTE